MYRTQLYGFLSSVFDLVLSKKDQHFFVPDYLKVILHPYIKNIYIKERNGELDKIYEKEENISEEKNYEITNILLGLIEERILNRKNVSYATLEELLDFKEEEIKESLKNATKYFTKDVKEECFQIFQAVQY